MRNVSRGLSLVAVALFLSRAQSGEAQVTATVAAEHSSGTFGGDRRVRTSSVSAALRVKRKRVSAFASLPAVRVDAPGNVVVTGGPLGLPILVDPTRPAVRVRRSGLGDAVIGASVRLAEPRQHRIAVAMTASAKLPTASVAKGLGTGKADFAVAAEMARPGKLTPFGALGYTIVGQPAAYRLRNITAVRGGLALRIGRANEISVAYNHASRISDGAGGRREVVAGMEATLSPRLSIGMQGAAGLSRGAPDASAGLRLGLAM